MSHFIIWWTICSSLCCVIPAIITKKIATKDFEGSTFIILIALLVYWISLGLVQGLLLNVSIPYSYIWTLVTILGGLISSWLLAISLKAILYILLKDVQLVGLGGSFLSHRDCLISIIILTASLFGSGFLLGLEQSLALFYLIRLNFSDSMVSGMTIPIVKGIIWFLTVPILAIILIYLVNKLTYLAKELIFSAKVYFLMYVCLITFVTIFINLIEGVLIKQIFVLSIK